ncbi:MAG: alkaline phosphatase [Odoribacter sp.]|nr:alkaline phosphatase [Odoribacter sp.]
MKKIFTILFLFLILVLNVHAQEYHVNKNTHSHNDYFQNVPFYTAYGNRFASIEIDVFLRGDELYVAHEPAEIKENRTIERLYIQPLLEQIELNEGKIYPEGGSLQFLIDLKTEAEPTLRCLETKLQPIRRYFDTHTNPQAVRLVISGNTPFPDKFKDFDSIFYFDGRPNIRYTADQMERIALYSAPFAYFSNWNGLGRIPEKEYQAVKHLVDSIHTLGKPVRFWGNPDTKTTWQCFVKLGVDYINTDSPNQLAAFLNNYQQFTVTVSETTSIYQPTYKTDGSKKKPKNVILLISDGGGFSQVWAAATANKGRLNVMNLKHSGYLQTNPADDYNTDSAAAGSAIATGQKTRNRHIGVDVNGNPVANIPEVLAKEGIISGIVTNDNITGATPSVFFAHQSERNMSEAIAYDLLNSPASIVVGGYNKAFEKEDSLLVKKLRQQDWEFAYRAEDIKGIPANKKIICFDKDTKERRVIEEVFDETINRLSANKKGFFLMLEGAKIDSGGHARNMEMVVDEYLSFDKIIGRALEFADKDGETLVIVTSDHEIGGLVLIDGNYETGFILGDFATNDHTGTPVPLFSYGPGAADFTGFVQNSELSHKIINCYRK